MSTKRKQDEFFNTARRTMVDCQIRPDGVINDNIIQGFSTIPRESFLPENLHGISYSDDTLTIDKEHFILGPSVHARMIEALNPKDKHIALDISASNGYSSAILASVVSTVIAVHPNEDQLNTMTKTWAEQEIYNAVSIHGPFKEGASEHAPFDLIFIHGAVPCIPDDIVAQLKPNGRLVCIIQKPDQTIGQAVLVRKTTQGTATSRALFETTAPYIPGFKPSSESFIF